MKFLLGCDPEIFLADAAGALKSSVGLIGGTKDQPRPLEELGAGFNVQEDNVAIEFGVPPARSKKEFIHNVTTIREFLSEQIKKHLGLSLVKLSAASFPASELQTEAAKMFGCEPDYNAWTHSVNPKPKSADKNLRSAGGHIHVGYKFANEEDEKKFIRMMDLCAGVPSVLLDDGLLRKELYGKHGAYRHKPYGVEYRVLSNFWIFEDKTIDWAWRATEQALDAVRYNKINIDALADVVPDCIDSNDKALAAQLVKEFDLQMV